MKDLNLTCLTLEELKFVGFRPFTEYNRNKLESCKFKRLIKLRVPTFMNVIAPNLKKLFIEKMDKFPQNLPPNITHLTFLGKLQVGKYKWNAPPKLEELKMDYYYQNKDILRALCNPKNCPNLKKVTLNVMYSLNLSKTFVNDGRKHKIELNLTWFIPLPRDLKIEGSGYVIKKNTQH